MKLTKFSIIFLVVAMLAACATTFSGKNQTEEKESIYYKSQTEADAALQQFDKDNPSCQLWSNWQKMCSRTGEGGATECSLDGQYHASPSRPFCAGKQGSGNVSEFLEPADKENLSRSRFCDQYDQRNGKIRCVKFKKDRPFNGYNLAGRLHAWCGRWDDAITFRPICQSDNKDPNLPNCVSLKRNHLETQNGFVCGKAIVPSWCNWSEGFGLGANDAAKGQDFLPLAQSQESLPVHGIYCRRSK